MEEHNALGEHDAWVECDALEEQNVVAIDDHLLLLLLKDAFTVVGKLVINNLMEGNLEEVVTDTIEVDIDQGDFILVGVVDTTVEVIGLEDTNLVVVTDNSLLIFILIN